MNRADRLTARSKQVEYYSDFMMNLDRNPISGELARVTNEKAIIRALKCLILTDRGECPFMPNKGSSIRSLLFEPMDDVTIDLIKSAINVTITQYESRVQLLLIDVIGNEDTNQYDVTITFSIVNAPSNVFSFSTVLKRLR